MDLCAHGLAHQPSARRISARVDLTARANFKAVYHMLMSSLVRPSASIST